MKYILSLIPFSFLFFGNTSISKAQTQNDLKVWALVIGTDAPQSNSNRAYAEIDAKSFYSFLRSPEGGALPESQIVLLLGEEATAMNIQHSMFDLFDQASSSDYIIFYFAGEGKDAAFLPYDYNPNNGANQLQHTTVKMAMQDSEAKYKLCIADASKSGSFIDSPQESKHFDLETSGALKQYDEAFDGIAPSSAVLMSSTAEQASIEDGKFGQGIFTYYLIRALKGHADGYGKVDAEGMPVGTNDQVISIGEIYNFVQKHCKRLNGQTPVINQQTKEGQTVYDPNLPVRIIRSK